MIRVRTIATGVAGAPWYVNLYFNGDLTGSASAASAVHTFWEAIKGALHQGITYQVDSAVVAIDPATGKATDAASTNTAATVGTNSKQMLPASNQFLIRLGTGGFVNGRRVEGKLYVPGMCIDAANADGTVYATNAALNAAPAQTMMVPASGSTTPPGVVWSRKGKRAIPVTAVTYWNQFAVLRSRRT